MWRHLSFWRRAETTCPPRLGKIFLDFTGFWSGNKLHFGECVCSMFAGDVWHDVCVFCFALSGARLCYSFVRAWAVLAILTLLCFFALSGARLTDSLINTRFHINHWNSIDPICLFMKLIYKLTMIMNWKQTTPFEPGEYGFIDCLLFFISSHFVLL